MKLTLKGIGRGYIGLLLVSSKKVYRLGMVTGDHIWAAKGQFTSN
jgi:hypothetical protein